MFKEISILLVGESDFQDALNPDIEYLKGRLIELNYSVKKVTAIEHDSKLISFQVEHGLKQSDFVILIERCISKDTSEALRNVFNTELVPARDIQKRNTELQNVMVPKLTKILEYENSINLTPVHYLGRLFVIRESNIKLVYENILKYYLKKFNKEAYFSKRFYFNDSDIESNDLKKICNCIQVDYEKVDGVVAVEIKSLDITKVVRYQTKLKKKYERVLLKEIYFSENIYDKNCFHQITKAIECVETCLLEYGPENVFLSFNGGKDCTVLLHLVLGVLRERHPDYKGRLICMYIQSSNPFPEVNSFIDLLSHYYNIEIITVTKNIKDGLQTFLQNKPHMKACLMGTRRSDPYSEHLNICQMTDPTWPQVMRISPLLNWNYCEIWDYLLYFQVPYCSLYDLGYTSLGSVNNTIKNPNLLYESSNDTDLYLPAYKLLDGSKERDGRR